MNNSAFPNLIILPHTDLTVTNHRRLGKLTPTLDKIYIWNLST